MATIIPFTNAPARAPAPLSDSAAAPASSRVVEMPGRYVRPLHRQHMAQAARDDGMMAALADDRPDLTEQLRQGEHTGPTARPVVTLGAKVLVGAVWIACAAYCIAIWLKVVP